MSDVDIDDELFALAGGDEEVDEGEVSSAAAPSSPADSLGSDAMEESDSDDDDAPAAPRDDLVEYPLEGKYKDAADRAYITSLPQLERERILGERAEEMNKMQWNSELQRRVAQRSGASDLKRKASSVEPDDVQRKTNRQKTSSAIESYKQYREERQQQRQRHEDRRRSLSPDRRHGSDVDADGESDVDYPEYDDMPRRDEPADLRDYERIRLGRNFFAKFCFDPDFDAAIPGAFVRVSAGTDPSRRAPTYKMAQIKAITTGKPYVFEGSSGRVATDQYVSVQFEGQKKDFSFSYMSNSRFTDLDYDGFRKYLAEHNIKPHTQNFVEKKFNEIKAFTEHTWTDAEISERLAKRNKYRHMLDARLNDSKPHLPTPAELEARRIAEMNKKNKLTETERVRKALLEERKAHKSEQRRIAKENALKKAAEETAAKKAEEEKAAAASKADMDDLFGEDSNNATPQPGTPKPANTEKKKREHKGLPTFRRPKMDDDTLAIDLGVEIEI